ncbi:MULTISPECIES: aldo/keto reductase [Amycolatopsis]|uniref:aldo/keto reductase n=1 Tax=Amycolatopsis TaxID=1813 RepID=UPI002378B4F9|nr:aldo/keto reductase [Amycolatopsis sp. CB00013]
MSSASTNSGPDKAAQAVRAAVEIGYRNIDTAQAYGNERGVGEGVRTATVPRDELFVSTKLAAEVKDYEGAVASIEESLTTLGLDHVDLMLIHSPQPWSDSAAATTPRATEKPGGHWKTRTKRESSDRSASPTSSSATWKTS